MEDAYVIGIRLALENGVSTGLAAVRTDLAAIDAQAARTEQSIRRLMALAATQPAPLGHPASPDIPSTNPKEKEARVVPDGMAFDPISVASSPKSTRAAQQPADTQVTIRAYAPAPAAEPRPAFQPAASAAPSLASSTSTPTHASTSPTETIRTLIPSAPASQPALTPLPRSTTVARPEFSNIVREAAPSRPWPDSTTTRTGHGPDQQLDSRSARGSPQMAPPMALPDFPSSQISPRWSKQARLPGSPTTPPPTSVPVAPPDVIPRTEPTALQQQSDPKVTPRPSLSSPMPSFAPSVQPQSQPQLSGDVYLDGTRLGRWITNHLGREASRPPSGATAFDPRMGISWSGARNGN